MNRVTTTAVAVLLASGLGLGLSGPGSAFAAGPRPSDTCAGGIQVLDDTSEDVRVTLYALTPTPTETDFCVRAEQVSTGVGVGGELVVVQGTPSVTYLYAPIPSVDTNYQACTVGVPNGVPGTHPVSSGSVAGVPYSVDAFVNNDKIWLCAFYGNTHRRVVVPRRYPAATVDPGASVAFNVDPS